MPAWQDSREKAELLALLSILLPLSAEWGPAPSAGSHGRCRTALGQQPAVVLQEMLGGSSGNVSATFLCHTGRQGRLWWHFYATPGDPDLLTAREFCFWRRQKRLHTHTAPGTSPRMEGVTEQLSQSLITLITYKLALLWGAELLYCLQPESSLGLQEGITKAENQACGWLSCGAAPQQAAGLECGWDPSVTPCAPLGLLHPGTHGLQMAKALFLQHLLYPPELCLSREMGNKGRVLLLIKELELNC